MAQKNNVGLIILIMIGFGIFIFFPNILGGQTIINPPIKFAGFTWEDSGTKVHGNQKTGTSSLSVEKGFLKINTQAGNGFAGRTIKTEVTKIDEVLIIYEGHLYCYPEQAGSDIGASISGSESGAVSIQQGIGCHSRHDPSISKTIQPAIWKFRNNWDGTWSSLQYIGVGDIFIVKNTNKLEGKAYLNLNVGTGGAFGGGTSSLTVYNVVVKESAFAVCKADEFWQDTNQDGTPQIEECFDLQTIVLNSEEAIKESFEEKFERIKDELERKNQGLEIDIDKLREELKGKDTVVDTELQQRIEELQEELERTKDVLEDVIARDKDIIESIEQQEKLQEVIEKLAVEKQIEKKIFPPIDEIPIAVWIILGLFIFIIIFLRF